MNPFQFIQEENNHRCLGLYVCVKCGLSMSWALSKEHCKTKLANRCKYDNKGHIWGFKHRWFP